MFLWINLKEDINTFLRVHYNRVFPLFTLVISQILLNSNYVKNYTSLDKIDHNSILTINLTLAGFLLTSLGIMISVSDKKFVKILIESGHWKEIHKSVLYGIVSHIASSLFTLIQLILKKSNYIVFNIEITSLLVGITYFSLTVFWLKKAFKYIDN